MSLPRIAAWCARHRLLVVTVWVAVLIGGVAGSPVLFDGLTCSVGRVEDSDSGRAFRMLQEAAPASGTN